MRIASLILISFGISINKPDGIGSSRQRLRDHGAQQTERRR